MQVEAGGPLGPGANRVEPRESTYDAIQEGGSIVLPHPPLGQKGECWGDLEFGGVPPRGREMVMEPCSALPGMVHKMII